MKYSTLKQFSTLFLVFCFLNGFAQNKLKLPDNTFFYMEMNGTALNKKINWEKFNPILHDVAKDKKLNPSWNDYSKTGIKYDGIQYHYASINDSVNTYTAHFDLDSNQKFLDFVNSTKKEGLEITKKSNYSYVSLDEETFVAWNEKKAVLKVINYSKPINWDDAIEVDSVAVVVDSAAVTVDSAYADPYNPDAVVPFDYKEEIKYLEEDLVYHKEELKRIEKDITYLKKHHKYPLQPEEEHEEDEAEETEEYDYAKEDAEYQKKMDSIRIEEFKIQKRIAELSFDEIFNSNFQLDVPKEKLASRNADADVFVYTDYENLIQKDIYRGRFFSWTNYLGKLYNSDSSYNLYFDQNKVRLVNSYKNRNPKVQKSFSEAYKVKKNTKLSKLISDKCIGYYAMNVDSYKTFDLIYDMMENMGDNDQYQKEIYLITETLKIALDEKAIAEIAPGNALFVLNKMSTKKVEYTEYEYDDDYNEKEIKKTKDTAVPDFTFAFVTEREDYWTRVFDMLTTSKETKGDFVKIGDHYKIKQKENSEFENIFVGVKDGIVYLTTSLQNLVPNSQSNNAKNWVKEATKYASSGRMNIQKLILGMEAEFRDNKDREMYNFLTKSIGELSFKTTVNNDVIDTEINYNIQSDSENSLMYFFDLVDMINKIDKSDKPVEIAL